MNKLNVAAYKLHAHTRAFKKKLADSQALCAEFLNKCSNPYVAFSTGKDSTVCLHLIRALAPHTLAIYNDHEWLLPEMAAMLAATPNVKRIARVVKHSEIFTSYANGKPPNLSSEIEWCDGSIRKDWVSANGYDGCAVGLRANENSYRRKHIGKMGRLFYAQCYGVWQCYPVGHWHTEDIWAYLVSRDVQYCAAYDVLSSLGVPPNGQRIGPLLNERVEAMGQAAILKQGWPDVFERLAQAYPVIRGFA